MGGGLYWTQGNYGVMGGWELVVMGVRTLKGGGYSGPQGVCRFTGEAHKSLEELEEQSVIGITGIGSRGFMAEKDSG
jgi:hypothetical protein